MSETPIRTARIVVVDDEPQVRAVIERVLIDEGYDVVPVEDAVAAFHAIATSSPDLVLSDVHMPGLTGIELCRLLKSDPRTRLIPVVLMTGLADRPTRLEGYEAGADEFLSKPFDSYELCVRVRSLIRLKRHTDELETAESLLLALGEVIEARDVVTAGHCQRLARYAVALGRRMGLSDMQLDTLRRGGFLHDIGKVGIPDALLMKPGPLTPQEVDLLRQHVLIGDRLCSQLRSLANVRPIVRHHHERRDGSGYPDGLRDDDIPLEAQILAVVDVFDALTTDRPYRRALDIPAGCVMLREEADRGLHRRDLVDAFVAVIQADSELLSLNSRDIARPASLIDPLEAASIRDYMTQQSTAAGQQAAVNGAVEWPQGRSADEEPSSSVVHNFRIAGGIAGIPAGPGSRTDTPGSR